MESLASATEVAVSCGVESRVTPAHCLFDHVWSTGYPPVSTSRRTPANGSMLNDEGVASHHHQRRIFVTGYAFKKESSAIAPINKRKCSSSSEGAPDRKVPSRQEQRDASVVINYTLAICAATRYFSESFNRETIPIACCRCPLLATPDIVTMNSAVHRAKAYPE